MRFPFLRGTKGSQGAGRGQQRLCGGGCVSSGTKALGGFWGRHHLLFTIHVFGELKTSSPAQRHSSSMGCKPSSAADYDHSVAHSKLSGAPRAHLLPVKRKSFQFSSISERRKWQICFKCLTEYLPHELLSLERENVPSTPQKMKPSAMKITKMKAMKQPSHNN